MIKKGDRLLISACLLGLSCNYKGQASSDWQGRPDFWQRVLAEFCVIPVCPEQLGGMPTPRIPAELQTAAKNVLAGDGLVTNRVGEDVTGHFVKGASEALFMAQSFGVAAAILKTRSPSCGKKTVYDGTFSGKLVDGSGLTASLLVSNGYQVFDELEFSEILVHLWSKS